MATLVWVLGYAYLAYTMKKDFNNRLSLLYFSLNLWIKWVFLFSWNSKSDKTPIRPEQIQSGLFSVMRWCSWGSLATEDQRPSTSTTAFLFPHGDSARQTLFHFQEKRINGKGTHRNQNLPLSVNHCYWFFWTAVHGSTSSSLLEKKAWFRKFWIGHPNLEISLRTVQIYNLVLYVIVQEMWPQIKARKRSK